MVKKTTPISKHRNIPEPTIARLPRYLRSFAEFAHNQHTVISSKELAGASGINPAQVRKDLAYFGQFGQRGIGYDVKTLDSKMREILGLHKAWRIALVGCGNLGTALLQYGGFVKGGFRVGAGFGVDSSEGCWGLEGVGVMGTPGIRRGVRGEKIQNAINPVPATQNQKEAHE